MVLVFLHLSPLSLAEKCRLAFGAAVVLILILALILPYAWMGQLTKKATLDSGRAKSETLLRSHFQLNPQNPTGLAVLDNTGSVMSPDAQQIKWISFSQENEGQLEQLGEQQKQTIESLKTEQDRDDAVLLTKKGGTVGSDYIRIFRSNENCISCHNQQGPARVFTLNEAIGAAVIEIGAGEISKTILLNRLWIMVALLIAGSGAVVAFYVITQRVILRPIRQLRGLANNVAEGNLDIRSSIKTRDEYEKLANAFNHMLDTIQQTQQKVYQANRQLDEKIAQLSERNIELFKANKVKGEFLANISHEFRTPLNAILGFAEILREKPGLLKNEKGRKYAENIIAGGKNLLNMVNDLLDLAKTEAGKMKLHIEPTNIERLCRSVTVAFSQMTQQKKIKVKLQVEKSVPILQTDAGKVQQILYNFLSNAIKFTPERGRIEINVSMPNDNTVRLKVIDSGCGISESDKEKIFEKFRQADGSITRQSAGTGLGLTISRELATLLAGTIDMESELGKGSSFWLDIPVTLAKDNGESRGVNG